MGSSCGGALGLIATSTALLAHGATNSAFQTAAANGRLRSLSSKGSVAKRGRQHTSESALTEESVRSLLKQSQNGSGWKGPEGWSGSNLCAVGWDTFPGSGRCYSAFSCSFFLSGRLACVVLGLLCSFALHGKMWRTNKLLNMSLTSTFFQALRRCHLKHIIALWQLLSTHKSEQLLRLRRVR